MGLHLGAGWHLHHMTDRCIELRKDDVLYRRLLGRDGYVRLRAEPGMDRKELLEKAVQMAKDTDAALSERIAKDLGLRNVDRYQHRQRELAQAFATPEDPEIIGRKSA